MLYVIGLSFPKLDLTYKSDRSRSLANISACFGSKLINLKLLRNQILFAYKKNKAGHKPNCILKRGDRIFCTLETIKLIYKIFIVKQ